jgi:hypothetical protein
VILLVKGLAASYMAGRRWRHVHRYDEVHCRPAACVLCGRTLP